MAKISLKRPPKCEELQKLLRGKIINGEIPLGGLFPSQSELSAAYEVSHITVREAVGMLAHEGLLKRIQGKGTFVADRLPSLMPKDAINLGLAFDSSANLSYPSVTFETQIITKECNQRSVDLRTFSCPNRRIKRSGAYLRKVVEAHELSGLLMRFVPCEEDVEFLKAQSVPFLVIGIPCASIPSVSVDIFKGAGLAAEHLLKLGHRRIGMLLGPRSDSAFIAEFAAGVEAAMSAHGVEKPVPEYAPWGPDSGKAYAKRLLGSPDAPTAVICAEDMQALGFMRQAVEMGLSIPSGISVVGYSDRLDENFYPVPLTTVDTCLKEQDSLSVALLLDMVAGKLKEGRLKVSPKLVVRKSTGAPRP